MEKCLLIFFEDPLKLAWISVGVNDPESFVYREILYTNQCHHDFNGFYDWLRTSNDEVIGVQFFPFEGLYFLSSIFKSLPYLIIDSALDGSPIFNIFFSLERVFDKKRSDDQSFAYNWLFKSETGNYALSLSAFGIDDLLKELDEVPLSKVRENPEKT